MPVMIMRGPHPCGPPGELVTQHLMEPPKLTGCFPNLTTLEMIPWMGTLQWLAVQS